MSMDLFDALEEVPLNILRKDGVAQYYSVIMPVVDANIWFDKLLKNIQWKRDEAIIFGKHYVTKRKVAWYGDEPFEYRYSNMTKKALPWISELDELKKLVEKQSGESFNSCLLNLYHDGNEGMAWHSDDEDDLEKNGAIASLSLGAERKFCFKHKQDKQTISLTLENGSLLLMKGQTQDYWLHRLPPTRKVDTPRINLTFRTIV